MSRGTSPWMSMDIHVLLNGIMVKDHGLTDHGLLKHGLVHGLQPWSLSMDVHGHPCFVKWHHGQR